jgi:ABC-type transporter Mla subunit MlaD
MIGGAIWLGASRFFEDTRRFVSYFSESVQGLDPGAAVKFRGVPAGRVALIGIAPDRQLIEVVMDIDAKVVSALQGDDTLRAQLQLSGITGLRYMEIDRRGGEALNQSPVLGFKPKYDVIPSARSSFTAVQNALADMYNKLMQLDVGGISADTRATLQSLSRLMQDERINTLLTNFAATSVSTQKAAKTVETVAENAMAATQEAKTLFANLNRGVKAEDLGQTLEQLNRLALNVQQFVLGLQSTTARLDRAVGNLQGLTDRIRQQPSLLLFGEPPAGRRSGDGAGK